MNGKFVATSVNALRTFAEVLTKLTLQPFHQSLVHKKQQRFPSMSVDSFQVAAEIDISARKLILQLGTNALAVIVATKTHILLHDPVLKQKFGSDLAALGFLVALLSNVAEYEPTLKLDDNQAEVQNHEEYNVIILALETEFDDKIRQMGMVVQLS